MNDEAIAFQEKVGAIFMPYAMRKMAEVKRSNSRFVHYTSAAVATSILRERMVWMRNATTMNDFMEVQHGLDCLADAYKGPSGEFVRDFLDKLHPGTKQELERRFDQFQPSLRTDTYLSCFSEHLDEEDSYGRLSMWRAYGGSTGVAIVMNSQAFASRSDALKAYTTPVLYADRSEFLKYFEEVSRGIQAEADFLSGLGKDAVLQIIFNVFRFAALCTKHPGFKEEREWRVIHSPTLEPSQRLQKSSEVVNGTPQIVYKIPLKNFPDEGLTGVEIPELIDRIIIGPTQYPAAMFDAFCHLLGEAGMPEPYKRVVFSNIPLRRD